MRGRYVRKKRRRCEEAAPTACAYHEAAGVLRGNSTRTNFAARHGAAARLSKRQYVVARAAAGRSSSACGAGVGDQFALVAVLRDWQQPALSPQLSLGCRAKAETVHVAANSVQPSFVVPSRAEAPPPSVTVGEAGDDLWATDVLELDGSTETSAKKAFKVLSSVIVPSKFGAPPESFGLDGL
ncbi:hypothetical protein CFC21_007535 [Triticum aestivum]|uniref:Uncharacterized protein n=2 Tax=Triticum aestivum TaxID=4565 RepID=A0A9R1IRW8_WHEAT|nr:uncharacterized protein LOC123093202 [Triticum aestivum]KAF6990334.1 hypothetical protein CFC21_007535 [Triticum aestivum]